MKSSISLSFSVAFDKNDMTGDMNKDSLESRISGLSFYVDFDNYTEYSIEGGYLKAEPNNQNDPNAIAFSMKVESILDMFRRSASLK